MKCVQQTLFGGPQGTRDELGNCYPACIASLLELSLPEVPHIHQLHPNDNERAHAAMNAFLAGRNLCRLNFKYEPWCLDWMPGVLAIFGGKSPRGDWNHAAIGEITPAGWKPIWDPHPDRTFFDGEPTDVEILFEPMRFVQLKEAA